MVQSMQGCDTPRINLHAQPGSIHLSFGCTFHQLLCLHRPRPEHVEAQMEPGERGRPERRAYKWEQYLPGHALTVQERQPLPRAHVRAPRALPRNALCPPRQPPHRSLRDDSGESTNTPASPARREPHSLPSSYPSSGAHCSFLCSC